MNLFDLFSEAADVFARSRALNVTGGSAELSALAQAYYGAAAVDYSSDLRKYVYLKSYAPKYALVWRTYIRLKQPWIMDERAVWQFNSIGTGPASEVIGVMESMNWAGKSPRTEVVCLESERTWDEVGKIVAELYRIKTGRDLALFYTDDVGRLIRRGEVFGSMVVSDMARAGTVQKSMAAIQSSVTPAKGLFLDTIQYTTPHGATARVSDQIAAYRGWFVNFNQEGLGEVMRSEMEKELAGVSCAGIFDISTEFNMNMIPVTF